MIKSTLVHNICVCIILALWIWFCAVKVPVYQEEQRRKSDEAYVQAIKEHEANYVDIVDSTGTIRSIPRDEYEAEQRRIETEESKPMLSASTTEAAIEEIHNYSEEDLELLAKLCESEAGIESYTCKVYVASVVLNRVASDSHPNNIHDVIWERVGGTPQFSVTITYDGVCSLDSIEPSEDSYKAAKQVLQHGTQLPVDVLVFYSTACDSGWVTERETYTQVDHTIFAYYWRKE